MKNILVLINLSAGAERLAKMAYKAASQCNANLLLCSVFELPVSQPYAFAEYRNTHLTANEQPYLTIEDLAEEVRKEFYITDNDHHQPEITCLGNCRFNSDNVKNIIATNKVGMIITGITDILDLKTSDLLATINKATCPVLVIPNGINFDALNTGAYLTDLRYCDLNVLSYLKELNAKIFVAHISLNGIPDMEDHYAQGMLSDLATAVKYNKLFLRNIKGVNRKKQLETITAMEKIQFFSIVNQKHGLLEQYISETAVNRRNYHSLPLLVMPYLNWNK